MAVKRERPNQGIPGQLHTRDGLVLKIRLPGGAHAAEGGGSVEPTPESANDTTEPDPESGPRDEPTPEHTG